MISLLIDIRLILPETGHAWNPWEAGRTVGHVLLKCHVIK